MANELLNNEHPKPAFTVEELRAREDVIDDQVWAAMDRGEGNLEQLRQGLIKKYLDELLSEKDRFAKIFKTGNGSVYFNLDGGETMRIKRQTELSELPEYSIQPPTKHLFFIAGNFYDTLKKILHAEIPYASESLSERKSIYENFHGLTLTEPEYKEREFMRSERDRLLGRRLPLTKLEVGAIPFELEFAAERGGKSKFILKDEHITLMGVQYGVDEKGVPLVNPEFVGVHHFGHPVTEIVKE